tara:strand:+ start:131 stop:538 length:408 start_codon:yes stop_codon:yes gene_type:complete
MSNTLNQKVLFILSTIFILNCNSNNNVNEEINLNKCEQGEIVTELSEEIPVYVKIVKDGEPFYNGSKTFYEVDSEIYLPEIFQQTGIKIVRIFPINEISNKVGSEIKVKGVIKTCFTGDHGLLTNNYIGFYLLEQ